MSPALRIGLLPAILLCSLAAAHETNQTGRVERLPVIRPALDFSLTSQDNVPVALGDYRGKTVAVTFIYTSCPDVCPMLTANLAQVQEALGEDFGARIAFISISVDPERDTPAVLREYAEWHGADLAGWSFLTGEPSAIKEIARAYGVAVMAAAEGVDHTFLTSLVDRRGMLRVQYMGSDFDLEEFRRDLLSLANEP